MIFEPTYEQKLIFDFFENENGHGMIDAVAGSGKTSTLINGIKFIPSNNRILFCAFNKKIQQEILNKTSAFSNVIVKTTYALGLSILRYHHPIFKEKQKDTSKFYHLLNDKLRKKKDSWEFLKESVFTDSFKKIQNIYYSNKQKDEPDLFYKTFYSNYYKLINLTRYTLSYNKSVAKFKELIIRYGIDINIENEDEVLGYKDFIFNMINEGISQSLKYGIYDFADMIFLPSVLKLQPKHKFDVIFIDECQDLSNAQLQVALFYRSQQSRIFAVGDPYQSIYGFAGASPKSFDNLKLILNPSIFLLTNCFRCSKKIIELAKEIRPDIKTKSKIEGEIEKIKFSEIPKLAVAQNLILSRFNSELFDILFDLLKQKVKCKILGKDEILKQLKSIIPEDEIRNKLYYRDLEHHLTLILNKAENKLKSNPANFEKLENLKDAIAVICSCYKQSKDSKNLEELFNFIDNLIEGEDNDSVILSSIHRAKGLEAEVVFIISYDELPYKKEGMLDWQTYQENCLKYVAITRAKNKLFLCSSPPKKENITKESSIKSTDFTHDYFDEINNLPF